MRRVNPVVGKVTDGWNVKAVDIDLIVPLATELCIVTGDHHERQRFK